MKENPINQQPKLPIQSFYPYIGLVIGIYLLQWGNEVIRNEKERAVIGAIATIIGLLSFTISMVLLKTKFLLIYHRFLTSLREFLDRK